MYRWLCVVSRNGKNFLLFYESGLLYVQVGGKVGFG